MKAFWTKKQKKEEFSNYPDATEIKNALDNLIVQCKKHMKNPDLELIKKAFHFCVDAHKNKERKSGESYYRHPLSVAHIVIKEIPLDQISVVCALLHDIPQYSESYNLQDIKSEFGQTIAEIVDGMTKIQHIEDKNIETQENYRKLLLSLFKDVRILLIKLAEMVHNVRTIQYLSDEEQKKLATEALEIYSPFAHRFGLANLKWELEDISFAILEPDDYKRIKDQVQLTRQEREDYVNAFLKDIKELLENNELFKKNNIKIEIYGRAKSIYSIYNKEFARKLPMEMFNDLIAFRIIIDSDDINYCYLSYGIISGLYKIVPGTFKNYVTNPKPNGYQSLHLALYGPGNHPVEVQIRTRKMHEIAEMGVAAHFNYKRGFLPADSIMDQKNVEEWLNLVKDVFENVGSEKTEELLENLRKQWASEEVYVFTPDRKFKAFPKDSTPIDFAFSIHEDIGKTCIGAKINGKIAPLNYLLKSGDQIEILHSQNQRPRKEWLDWVVTSKAKNAITKFLNSQKQVDFERGKIIWNEFLSKNDYEISDKKLKKIANSLGYNNEKDFFVELANSGLSEDLTIELIKELLWGNKSKKKKKEQKLFKKKKDTDTSVKKTLKENQNGSKKYKKIKYANCCYPVKGDVIVGQLADNANTLEIHLKKCKKYNNSENGKIPTLINIDWNEIEAQEFDVKVIIKGKDKPDILNLITKKLSEFTKLTIKGFQFNTVNEEIVGSMLISIPDTEYLQKIFDNVLAIKGIKSVDRHIV